MKIKLLLGLIFLISLTLVACSNSDSADSTPNKSATKQKPEEMDGLMNGKKQETTKEDVKIKLTFSDEEVIVTMYDNPTSKDFLQRLPLTLRFEDYGETEKIHYLDDELSTEGAPSGDIPLKGDFAYYSPWGNLAIYYEEFSYSEGLIKLGEIESGIEKFEHIKGDFTIRIEKND